MKLITQLPDKICHLNPVTAEKILTGALAVAATAVLLLFIALSCFDYPSADDFCYAAKAKQLGFLDAQAFWYKNWSGRYTLSSTWTIFSLSGDIFQIYRYPPMILLLSTWLGFCFLIAQIAQRRLSRPFIFLLGGIVTVLYIAGLPNPAMTFYWIGGSFTYQMANVFFVFLLGLLLWRETAAHNKQRRILIFLLASVLAVATIGLNELSLLLTDATLCSGALFAVYARRDSRAFWVGLLLIAIVATLVSVLAPGNYQRYLAEHQTISRPPSWLAMILYIPWVVLRLLYWLSNLGIWSSAFILLITTFDVVRTQLYVEGRFKRFFLALPVIWVGTIFILNAIGFLINSYPLPDRAESVVYLVFLLGWYPSFVIIVHFLFSDGFHFNMRRLVAPAAALLLISVLGAQNIFEGYKDVYRGPRYSREIQERIETIQAAKNRGEMDVIVASLSRPPMTVFVTDLTTDPNNMRNECAREYHELNSIRLGSAMTQ
ncbi:MAG: DUF6056 family protein [Candidatus Competibacteraceae bacterium]